MARCEDYPCCGHTDGLGCDWVYTPEAREFDQRHVFCEHEHGWCEVEQEAIEHEQDEEYYGDDEPFVQEDQYLDSYMEDRMTTMFE
jgi:hypothetical protein